jgi:2-keto-3-deoxy-L-rhamnonate aldolase RhmA
MCQMIANDEVIIVPMIETQEAIDNIDAILDVPGISGIYIGRSDLGFSLGLRPMLDREDSDLRKAREGEREARSVHRHPQRLRRLCRAYDRDGLPVRHHRQ